MHLLTECRTSSLEGQSYPKVHTHCALFLLFLFVFHRITQISCSVRPELGGERGFHHDHENSTYQKKKTMTSRPSPPLGIESNYQYINQLKLHFRRDRKKLLRSYRQRRKYITHVNIQYELQNYRKSNIENLKTRSKRQSKNKKNITNRDHQRLYESNPNTNV